MSKFSGAAAVKEAQKGNLAGIDLPTGQAPELAAPTPEPAAPQGGGGGFMAELKAESALAPEDMAMAQADIQAGIDETIEPMAAEVERQSIPSMAERSAGGPRMDRWLRPPTPVRAEASQSPDGNLRSRAGAMAKAVEMGSLTPIVGYRGTEAWGPSHEGVAQPELADTIAAEKEGDLTAALSRANAITESKITGKTIPSPAYVQVASAVTENMMAQVAFNNEEVNVDPLDAALEEESSVPSAEGPTKVIPHASGTGALGQQIHQEFQRMSGIKVPEKLPRKEAETVGAVFKDLWAANNPELVTVAVDPKTLKKVYQLTATGETNLKNGSQDRKRLFPKTRVRPSKIPLKTGELPGDVGQNVVRRASGVVGKVEFGKVIKAAMTNLAQVPNVVNVQRAKILYSTLLPVLQSGDHSTWMAEINNFGPSKIQKFDAAAAAQMKRMEVAEAEGVSFDEELYDPQANMDALTDKIAQEVQAIAKERKGANYLSYNVQGFQGRISPQQSFFDPTSSKAVRFVTTNAVPAIAKPGSRIEKNLRQMYAMMLVKGADQQLPLQREIALDGAAPQLEKWGERIAETVQMSDAEYEAVSTAIEQGVALDDEKFPQIKPNGLDPEADADLIKMIESKGEDGPHFMDGLVDFANYAKAKRKGQPYASYFNAYMDGKTNGLASNGIQMGHLGTAERTGVVRNNRKSLLDSEGDIRDVLKNIAVQSIQDGWDGDTDGFESELNDVAEQVFSHRALNKQTTMTFGYGKEIESFTANVEEALAFLSETKKDSGDTYNTSLQHLDSKMTRKEIAETLMGKYEASLREVMSDEALDARSLMRSAAALHSATNTLLSIKSPIGMDINLGRDVSTGYIDAGKTDYRLYGEGGTSKKTVAHYNDEATSAADRDGAAGEHAYGGSVVAPVQALDATTVALTAAGKSWDRLKQASGGNPYMHTIYDAFKVDAAGYDVVLEEVNKNWLDSSMNWSYLEATYDATQKAMGKFQTELKEKDPNATLSVNEKAYMNWFLKPELSKSGKPIMKNFLRKIGKFKEVGESEIWEIHKKFANGMKDAGYDVYDPPYQPTVKQLSRFVHMLAKELNLKPRMEATIKRTNANKKVLKEEILKRGYKTPSGERIALQYYAH